ncbi:MAG: hypothetical protein AB7T01_07995 [Acidithiobacillus sp.]
MSGRKRRHSRLVAPDDCEEFQRFYAAVTADPSISADNMLEMFRDLGVYGHLTELWTITRNLREVLDIMFRTPDWDRYLAPVQQWPRLLDWILKHPEVVSSSKYNTKTANKNPLVHLCTTSHPLYASLWTSTEQNQLQEFRLLQGQVLIGHLTKIRRHEEYAYDYRKSTKAPYGDLIAGTYRCGLALRELSLETTSIRPDMLRPERPPELFAAEMYYFWQTLEEYAKTSRTSPQSDSSEEEMTEEEVSHAANQKLFDHLFAAHSTRARAHLQSLCYDVAEAFEYRHHRSRHRNPGKAQQRDILHGYLPLMKSTGEEIAKADDDPATTRLPLQRGGEASSSLGRRAADARRFEREFDLDPEENMGAEYVEMDLECALASRSAPSLHSMALRGQMQAEALQNQVLPWDYDLLTDTALRTLWERMGRDFAEELTRTTERPSTRAEYIALLSVLLWTGCGVDVACKLEILGVGEKTSLRKLSLQVDSAGSACWVLRVPVPSYEGAAKIPESVCMRIGESPLYLPDYAQGSDYVQQLVRRYPGSSGRVFAQSSRFYRKNLPSYLRSIDPSGYLSLAKVEDYLWRRLASTGDLAEADLIVGKQHRLAQVRRFYTTLSTDALADRYRSVVSEVLRDLGQEMASAPSVTSHAGFVGAVYRPTLPAIQQVVRALQEDLQAFSARWRSLDPQDSGSRVKGLWQEHYNQFTLYTWLLFVYGTAARVTCKPFSTGRIQNAQEGFIAYSDKTTPDQSHVRLLWLPVALVKQLQAQQVFAASTRESLTERRNLHIDGSSFFLGTRAAQPLCPKVLAPELKRYFGYEIPVNSHRRFCRSYLLEQGCPVEVVDAFLGHWYTGESPWSRYSSQSATEYVRQLQPFLQQMLGDLGFRFMPLPAPAQLRKEAS